MSGRMPAREPSEARSKQRTIEQQAKLDALHETLVFAVDALVSGHDWARALAFAARFRSRSFNNTLLIWVQHGAAFEAGRVPEPVTASGSSSIVKCRRVSPAT